MKNYFQVLELPDDATQDEVRTTYRKLAKRYHPDVNKSPDAHEKFCEITEAYEFLIHHWFQYSVKSEGKVNYEQYYRQHQESGDYERFRREAQARANQQARMRYEKFKKQHEAFQESGLNDIALIFTIIMRFISAVLFFFLFFTPPLLAIKLHWTWIFVIFFMWPFAIGLAWYYYDNRKNYFYPWKLYYNVDRIRHLFTDKKTSLIPCYYSKGKLADSRPYKLDLLKLKDIKLQNRGFRQYNVNYVNESYAVMIPRSAKAFVIHSLSVLFKITALIGCLLFLDVSSFIWRFIIGIFAGGLLTRIMLIITRTKSNITYLYSYDLLIRVSLWVMAIALASRFYIHPFNIYPTDAIHFVVAAIIIFDSFLMQLIVLIIGKHSSFPVFKQYHETTAKFNDGYIVYNDVPVISILYPMYKWIFG